MRTAANLTLQRTPTTATLSPSFALTDPWPGPLSSDVSRREAKAIELDTGLYLEGRGTRPAWYSSPEELRQFTHPDYCAAFPCSPHSLMLAWNDRVFGDLRCQVTAAFGAGRESLCGVRLVFQYPEGVRSIPAGFGWLGRRLAEHFGPPLSVQEDGERGEAHWAVRGVALRHEYFDGMGGGHYVFIFPRQA